MAFARGSSVINFNDEKSELEFQDFGHSDAATLETSDFNDENFPMASELESESAGLLSEEKKPASFWEFSYYQSFFDVDTDQVIQRVMWSMLPIKGRATYLDRVIRPTPDLYGPIWISTTLIVSIAISANIADYFMSEGEKKELWHYDFHKMSIVATAIYSYVTLLPLIIWALMWYQPRMIQYTLLEIICVYGYSLFIYIPISILWLIQVAWLQWMLVIIGATLSGLVLVHTFWPTVQDVNRKIGVAAVCLIMLFHVLLASGFVLYFFHPTNTMKSHDTVAIVSTNASEMTAGIAVAVTEKPSKIVSRNANENESISAIEKLPNLVRNLKLKEQHKNTTTAIHDIKKSVSAKSPTNTSASQDVETFINVITETEETHIGEEFTNNSSKVTSILLNNSI